MTVPTDPASIERNKQMTDAEVAERVRVLSITLTEASRELSTLVGRLYYTAADNDPECPHCGRRGPS